MKQVWIRHDDLEQVVRVPETSLPHHMAAGWRPATPDEVPKPKPAPVIPAGDEAPKPTPKRAAKRDRTEPQES